MIKSLLLIISLGLIQSLQADPYYFKAECKRQLPGAMGREIYILGTMHDLPLTDLPQAVKNHIREQQQKGAVFVGESATGTIKDRQFTDVDMVHWREKGYFHKPHEASYLDILNDQQKQQLYHYINIVYPDLIQGTNPIKLEYFNHVGLFSLYRAGRNQLGMDTALADLFGNKKASLDRTRLAASDLIARPGEGKTLGQILDTDRTEDPDRTAYLKGQLEAFETKASLEDPLVKGRNEAWIPGILQNWRIWKNILVGVGCAHLLDLPDCKHSVLELLRKQGFSIKRMRDDGTWVHYADAIGADPPAPIALPSKQPAYKTPHHKAPVSKKGQSQAKLKRQKKLKKAKRTKAHQRRLARLKQQRLQQQRLKKLRLNRIKRAKMRRKNHMR